MNKQDFADWAKKILDEKTIREERLQLEDKLVELAYQLASKFEVTPEDLENARDLRRAKIGPLATGMDWKNELRKKLEMELTKLTEAAEKTKVIEGLGDVLEIVETYTASV